MTNIIKPKPGIMDIELYVGGKSHAVGVENTVKLSSNENPFGPSPKAKDAYIKQSDSLAVYLDPRPTRPPTDLGRPPGFRQFQYGFR